MRTAVLGAAGVMGRAFAKQLNASWTVTGVDILTNGDTAASHVCADVTAPDAALQKVLRGADCVLACLPESVLHAALAGLLEHMQPGALLVDTLSVKSSYVSQIERLRGDIEVLSLNPMFGRDVAFEGQNVIAVSVRQGPRCEQLLDQIRVWGAHVVPMSAKRHDELTAALQVATHAAILAFGDALQELSYDVSEALAVSTPPHRALLALFARALSVGPEVYWEIQTSNPYAGTARAALERSLARISRAVTSGDRAIFDQMFARGERTLGTRAGAMATYCADLFNVSTQRPDDAEEER